MENKINWPDFESKYWSPEKGTGYDVVLGNWRQELRSFDDGKTEKPVLVFDVFRVDNVEYVPPKLFVTSAASFAEHAKPIVEAAEALEKSAILVYLEYTKDKRYIVRDLRKLRGDAE